MISLAITYFSHPLQYQIIRQGGVIRTMQEMNRNVINDIVKTDTAYFQKETNINYCIMIDRISSALISVI